MIKISEQLMRSQDFIDSVPEDLKKFKYSGQLNKLAEAKLGLPENTMTLGAAIYGMAKRAYIHRQQWKTIHSGINSLREIDEDE
jgi:hypothetical protein